MKCFPLNKVLIISIFLFKLIYPQVSDISFDRIFLEQGLSQSIINCMLQDKKGFMFYGTEDGLNIYDGYKFNVLRNIQGDTNSLSYNDITSLVQDKYGRIWVGTFNAGMNLFLPGKKIFKHFNYRYNDINSLCNDNINSIIIDNDGVIWIGTDSGLNRIFETKNESQFVIKRSLDGENENFLNNVRILSLLNDKFGNIWIGTVEGLYKISKNKNHSFQINKYINNPENKSSLSNDVVRKIFEDSKGNLWIGTSNGLNKTSSYNTEVINFNHYFHNVKDKYSLSHNDISSIAEDGSGSIWIGTNGGGINIFNKEKNHFEVYQNDPLDVRSVSVNEIRTLFLDNSGIMWIGTYGGGLNKVSRGKGQHYHDKSRKDDANSLSHKIIWSFYQDKDSILWVGTHNGLDKLDRKTNSYRHYLNTPDKNSLSNNMVRVIAKLNDGKLLLGTNGGGIDEFDPITGIFKNYSHKLNDANSISRNEIRCIYIDRDNDIWIGTYGSGLDKFNKSKSTFTHYTYSPNDTTTISHNYIRTIAEDKNGDLWIGTEGGGLNKFNKKTGKFTRYLSPYSTLTSAYIFSISFDSSGNLWIGTFDNGLNKFNPANNTCEIFNVDKGLPSNSIYAVVLDNNGYYWLSTNNGLSRFNPKEKTFKNFNAKDGLQDNEFNGGAYFKTKSGELLFGGINGFSAFYPDKIKDNKYIPPIVLTSFKIFNKEADFSQPLTSIKEIELTYSENIFSIEFAALDYSSPGKNMYAYKMEGVDKDWVYVSSDKRFASYTTLPSGNYTFYVKGSNSDGLWNKDGIKVLIKIIPPVWERWWFILLASLLLLGIFFLLYLRRLRIMRMKIELRTAHDAQLSIMPHSDPVHPCLDISGTCIPAYEVGGDFFDYFYQDSDKSKFGIMIGDVSGKAMKAAITAIMTSGMIISEVKSNRCISKVLDNVNTSLINKIDKKMFVSICLSLIDVENKSITFSNAGLNRPIIISDEKINFMHSDGPRLPLGLKENITYQQISYPIKKNDLIIFTTDGINEAQNNNRELFGDEKLLEYIMKLDRNKLSAAQIKSSIINKVLSFTKKEKPSDDMTVIAVKIL